MNTSAKQTENLAECGNKSKPLLAVVLSYKQRFVIDYLKSIYDTDFNINGAWASPTLVGKVYGIKFLNKDNCHSSTGSPILKKLAELGFVERDKNGWYRFLKNYR